MPHLPPTIPAIDAALTVLAALIAAAIFSATGAFLLLSALALFGA